MHISFMAVFPGNEIDLLIAYCVCWINCKNRARGQTSATYNRSIKWLQIESLWQKQTSTHTYKHTLTNLHNIHLENTHIFSFTLCARITISFWLVLNTPKPANKHKLCVAFSAKQTIGISWFGLLQFLHSKPTDAEFSIIAAKTMSGFSNTLAKRMGCEQTKSPIEGNDSCIY